jgi:hypothetical protein
MTFLRATVSIVCAASCVEVAIAQEPCLGGWISVQPAVARVGEDVVFEAYDGAGYCSALRLVGVSVDGSRLLVELETSPGGPAACAGDEIDFVLPTLAPGSYEVEAHLSFGGASACSLGTTTLEVSGGLLGRFGVDITWRTADRSGTGELMSFGEELAIAEQSAFYWFFNPQNLEVAVKMVDGCEVNGHRWLFVSGFTDQAYDVAVTDLFTGAQMVVSNPLGQLAEVHADTGAFPCGLGGP